MPKLTNERIRTELIKKGVANLQDFGYADASPENILTQYIFSRMFDRMLEDNLGVMDAQVDGVIADLRKEIASCQAK